MDRDDLFKTVLEASEIGLVLLDHGRRVAFWNSWMSRFARLPTASAVGHSLEDLFGESLGSQLPNAIDEALLSGTSSVLSSNAAKPLFPLVMESNHDGDTDHLTQLVVVKPVDLNGELHCLIMVTDVSDAESHEQAIRHQARTLQVLAENYRLSEMHVHAIVENTADAIVSFGADGSISSYNPAAEWIFGHTPTEIIGRPIGDLIPDLAALSNGGLVVLEPFTQGRRETLGQRKDDTAFPLEVTVSEMELPGQTLYVAVAHDITERKAAEEEIMVQKQWLDTLIDALPDIVCFMDGEGRWLVANRFYLELFRLNGIDYAGRTASELAAHTPLYEKALAASQETDDLAWQREKPITFENTVHLPGGGEKIFDIRKTPIFNPDGSRKGLVVFGRDITEKRLAAQRIHHLAHHDGLTDLPNRVLFQDRLRVALAQAKRSGSQTALLMMDLDRLKDINDLSGHHVGDLLLRAVAKRLGRCLRETDTVARVGGDEFAVVLTHVNGAHGAGTVAESIQKAIAEPFGLENSQITTSISIGATIFPADGEDMESLLKNADLALNRAKLEGAARYRFYTPEMDEEVRRRKVIERDLRHALTNGQLKLFYQPLVCMKSGKILGAEALIRWYHPENGPIAPDLFIPIAERTDLIAPLGRWVMEEAFSQARRWQDAGLPPMTLAVNLSPAQFRHHDLLETVSGLLEKTGADPTRLQLEITETTAMHNFDFSVDVLHNLRELGLSISIDDFGTGYSSLNRLKRFPVEKLKIDRSFVTDIGLHPDNAAIVKAIIELGHGIGTKVNVEGVETAEQLEFMRRHGCDEVQGFYFSRPLPPEDFFRLTTHPLPWLNKLATV